VVAHGDAARRIVALAGTDAAMTTLRANSPLVRRERLLALMKRITLADCWDDTDLARAQHCSPRTLRRDKDWLRAKGYLRPLKDLSAPQIGRKTATHFEIRSNTPKSPPTRTATRVRAPGVQIPSSVGWPRRLR
jgi:hypothetical protein